MAPVVATLSSQTDRAFKGLVIAVHGPELELSLLPGAARSLLAEQAQAAVATLELRFHSRHWHDTPPLQARIVKGEPLKDSYRLEVELLDWIELARFWARELHWGSAPSR